MHRFSKANRPRPSVPETELSVPSMSSPWTNRLNRSGQMTRITRRQREHRQAELNRRLGQLPLLIAATVAGVDLQRSPVSRVVPRVVQAFA
jgi:hypothetical protein